MEAQNFILYCFFIASSNAFSLLPSFLDQTPAIIESEAYEVLKLQNEIPVRNTISDDLLLDPSVEENVAAEPASAVLSHLRSMLNSPYEETKGYATEKAKELVTNLEHNTNKVIRFTLDGVNLLVDLGIKGSPTRLRNVEQGKSLMEYIGELFAWVGSYIMSWFVSEQTDKKVNKDHKQTDKDKAANSKSNDDSINNHEKDKKQVGKKITGDTDLPQNPDKSIVDNQSNSNNQSKESKNKEKREPILKSTSNDIIFIPPKELSAEEKVDVESARQRIVTIEKTIHELEDKTKQHTDDDEKTHLKQLKNQAKIMKQFIKISTSEYIQ